MAGPDVSVIIAVYNTMPYLTGCLDSVLEQTIGVENLEIVAVNDGSTDGGGEELERFAALHPGTVKVAHQENSGGPAVPSNRALEQATGRYVYFLGADDHLGPQALKRMVDTADAHECDVVVGKMAGVGGRWVYPDLYESTDLDVDLYDSKLPYALSNTKLFRRRLVERYKLRFPEDMPVGSDQPFTIEACVRASRIAVLSDYDYYYAVRREDASNITYRVDQAGLTAATARIMHTTAGLLEAGPQRDAIMFRHFDWDLAKCLRVDLLARDREMQELVCAGVAELADAYLTDGIRDGLEIRKRHRLALARQGAVDLLCASLRMEQQKRDPGLVVGGERAYYAYPGFRDPGHPVDDRCFEVHGENLSALLARNAVVEDVSWGRGAWRTPELRLGVRFPVGGDAASAHVSYGGEAMPKHADRHGIHRLRRAGVPAPPVAGTEGARQEVTVEGDTSILRGSLPVEPGTRDAEARVRIDLAGTTYEMAVPAPSPLPPSLRGWHRASPYRVTAEADRKGRLVVGRVALPLGRLVKRRLRKAAAMGRKNV